jgi:hypothetical protein
LVWTVELLFVLLYLIFYVCHYSDWPTIPQLYVKGEFVGGCDIVTAMFKDGELETLMKENKLLPPATSE